MSRTSTSSTDSERERFNRSMKQRRAKLREKGICVDCQAEKVKPVPPGKKPHVCCEYCLKQRRERWRVSQMIIPLPFTASMPV